MMEDKENQNMPNNSPDPMDAFLFGDEPLSSNDGLEGSFSQPVQNFEQNSEQNIIPEGASTPLRAPLEDIPGNIPSNIPANASANIPTAPAPAPSTIPSNPVQIDETPQQQDPMDAFLFDDNAQIEDEIPQQPDPMDAFLFDNESLNEPLGNELSDSEPLNNETLNNATDIEYQNLSEYADNPLSDENPEIEKSIPLNAHKVENSDKRVTVRPVRFQQFDDEPPIRAIKKNLDILHDVSLHVSVELGRTKSSIREVIGFEEGSVIELDKIAGEQVEIFVNDKIVAKGEVIVIEDKFGVRVTSTNIPKNTEGS